jgi:demethylmenaquinone methyltransferase/2-methoxy-6-polyprenyl-1,4-benzoquinol methylase
MDNKFHRSFGFQEVETRERQSRIRRVFNAVAPRYDLMNDLMSFGIHRLWKRRMVRFIKPDDGLRVVDLAGGTGDVARLMARDVSRQVIVCDASEAMMKAGKTDHSEQALRLGWLAAEGEALPFHDESIDVITIAFGLRNMTWPEASLLECARVLKPGGRFICLEFSKPVFWLRPFYDFYSFFVIPRLGAFVAREPMAYQYLIESIRRFPGQNAVKKLLENAGLVNVSYTNLSLGIACIHCGLKPEKE